MRTVAAIAVGVCLAVLVLRNSLPAYLAQTRPSAAIVLAPDNATARLRLAEAALAEAKASQTRSPGQDAENLIASAETSARSALKGLPLSAHAHRILGEIAALKGDRERADRLIAAAAGLSRHEYTAVILEAQRSWEGDDIGRALNASVALVRSRPDLAGPIMEAMGALSETPAGRPLVKQLLLEGQSWTDGFLTGMLPGLKNATTPLDLMLHLKSAGRKIPPDAVNTYVRWLLSHQLHGLAYTSWLQLLDREQLLKVGFVFNGDFSAPPTGAPFDWSIRRGTGVSVEITSLPDAPGNRALKIEMSNTRALFGEVFQRLNLAPGDYVLTGNYRGEYVGRRGLQWRIQCIERSETQLVQTQMFIGQFKTWREFSLPVTIPSQNCPNQILRLVLDARYSAEQFGSGLIWFDDLRISRASQAPPTAPAGKQSSVERSGAPP